MQTLLSLKKQRILKHFVIIFLSEYKLLGYTFSSIFVPGFLSSWLSYGFMLGSFAGIILFLIIPLFCTFCYDCYEDAVFKVNLENKRVMDILNDQ